MNNATRATIAYLRTDSFERVTFRAAFADGMLGSEKAAWRENAEQAAHIVNAHLGSDFFGSLLLAAMDDVDWQAVYEEVKSYD